MDAALSIVIPAYNEAQRLPATVAALAAYFTDSGRDVEVILVDDGSSDGTGLALPHSNAGGVTWRLLRNTENRGKGYSVRRGMLEASGQRLLFTDADLSAPIAELPKLERALDAGADIAIGSRCRRDLIQAHQSRFRENAGRVFNLMVRIGLGLPFTDTQCGFKLFTRAAAEAIFPEQHIEGWGFDPELLFLAQRQGLRVEEVPVVWSHAPGAKIHMLRDSLRMFGDVLAIRRRWRTRALRQGSTRPHESPGRGTNPR